MGWGECEDVAFPCYGLGAEEELGGGRFVGILGLFNGTVVVYEDEG